MLLPKDDKNKYKPLYISTAKDYLKNMQMHISNLLKKEQKEAAIKQIHIDAHSLKSQSQVMGYNKISKISEIIEHSFNKYEKENLEIKQDTLIKIQKALTRISDSIMQLESSENELDLTEIINELEEL